MNQNYFKTIAVLTFFFTSLFSGAQSSNELWTSINEIKANQYEQVSRKLSLSKEKFYQLDIEGLKNALLNAGNRENIGNTVISFPNSEGKLNSYRVFEASVMAPDLQAQFPNMRSYAGQGIENPAETVRFSITPKGLNAMFLGTSKGTQFIDPFSTEGNIYTVYGKKDLQARNFDFECEVIDDAVVLEKTFENTMMTRNANDGTLRDYRIAIACTGEYTIFHGGTVPGAIAAIVTTMTRVNGIYERELSITMTLVANNADIVFTDPETDPFDNNNSGILINQSQSVINSIIMAANYDIGHTFSTGGGGLASPGVTCDDLDKAKGITGSPQPVGDPYDIDFVAHEIGHQFDARHTFNGTGGNCSGGNRDQNNAFEPGSGSTIMAYAGICGSNNIQNNSDAYFHQNSLNSIWAHILSTGSCPVGRVATGNIEPVAQAGANYTIPQGTPYKLDGGASSDPDGIETLTYTWEQFDLGPAGLPTEMTLSGPLTRSFEGTTNPIRYVPRLRDVLDNGGTSTTWEKLATVDRAINYRLTVRDNDASGGQTAVDQMTATVTTTAGPFVITSQNTSGVSWDNGSTQTITWNVAGTNANGVNAANVNILLSTDGGLNFNTVLASGTPNDGSHDITVPNDVAGTSCRIMIEGANNIFFNVNTAAFQIGTVVCNEFASGTVNLPITDGTGTTSPITGPPLVNVINVPDNFTIETLKFSVDINHTYVGDLLVRLIHPDGITEVNVWAFNCDSEDNLDIVFEDDAAEIDCGFTGIGNTYNPIEPLSEFTGLNSQGDWTILIADFFAGDTGTLNNWSIEFCSTEGLLVHENTLDNLSIYPNPNNGEFNIGFKPKSGEDITVEVYDIRGRAIYTKVYRSTGSFDEVIRLNNAQSGVYLLNISDGSQKVTKKIIVD